MEKRHAAESTAAVRREPRLPRALREIIISARAILDIPGKGGETKVQYLKGLK